MAAHKTTLELDRPRAVLYVKGRRPKEAANMIDALINAYRRDNTDAIESADTSINSSTDDVAPARLPVNRTLQFFGRCLVVIEVVPVVRLMEFWGQAMPEQQANFFWRAIVQVPPTFIVGRGWEPPPFHIEWDGYQVQIYGPVRRGTWALPSEPTYALAGKPAHLANTLFISFEGKAEQPRDEIVEQLVNLFLRRIRRVTQAPAIRRLTLKGLNWQLIKCDLNGHPVESGQGKWGLPIVHAIVVDDVIRDIQTIDDTSIPPWEELILDAIDELPRVGTAVTLAQAALEMFIAIRLGQMVERSTPEVKMLFKWIADREQGPVSFLSEKFDVFLRALCGHSLKEDNDLWEKFKSLQSARNTFVHSGKVSIDLNRATILVHTAAGIVQRIEGWLPGDLQSDVYTPNNRGIGVTLNVFEAFSEPRED